MFFVDFESPYPFSLEFQVGIHLYDFEGKKDICLPFLACASSIATSNFKDTSEDVLNIHDPSIPLPLLEEPEESEECQGNSRVCDHEHDDWYGMVIMLIRRSV